MKYLLVALFVCTSFFAFGQKQTKLNRKAGLIKSLTQTTEDELKESAFGEDIEQLVTIWAMTNKEIADGDLIFIHLLDYTTSKNKGMSDVILVQYQRNQEPSEVLMLYVNDGKISFRMQITKDFVFDLISTLFTVAVNDTILRSVNENSFNIMAYGKAKGEIYADGSAKLINVSKEVEVTLKDLKTWNGIKVKFETPEMYDDTSFKLIKLGDDQHIFSNMRNPDFKVDYNERSIRLWDKKQSIYSTLYITNIVNVLFQD